MNELFLTLNSKNGPISMDTKANVRQKSQWPGANEGWWSEKCLHIGSWLMTTDNKFQNLPGLKELALPCLQA